MKRYLFMASIVLCLNDLAAEVPPTCLPLLKTPTVNNLLITDPKEKEYQEVLKKILAYISEIVDLKFKASNFIQENKRLYGRYKSSEEAKVNLDESIHNFVAEKKYWAEYYDELIKELNPEMPEKQLSEIIEEYLKEREEQLKILKRNLRDLYSKRTGVHKDYFNYVEKWAPYREHLSQLAELEASLLKSLEDLKKLKQIDQESFRQLVQVVSGPSRSFDQLLIYCKNISTTLRLIAEKSPFTKPKFIPRPINPDDVSAYRNRWRDRLVYPRQNNTGSTFPGIKP